MNISEVIKNRTSLRVYDDRMVEDQDLEKILARSGPPKYHP